MFLAWDESGYFLTLEEGQWHSYKEQTTTLAFYASKAFGMGNLNGIRMNFHY